MRRFLLLLFAASCLATAPRCAAAQEGGALMQTTARTQFLLQDGEVVRREGDQITPLTQNVKLANGTKINLFSDCQSSTKRQNYLETRRWKEPPISLNWLSRTMV